MSFVNQGLVAAVSRVISAKYTPKLVKWLGAGKPLTAEKTIEIEARLNKMGAEKVGKAHLIGTLCTLPLVGIICLILGLPFIFPERAMFAGWDDLVLVMPNWVHILAALPIIAMAAIFAMHLAIAVVRVFHKFKWPGQSTDYLYYMDEGVSHGPDGFKVHGDYVALSRIIFTGAFIIYALVLSVHYLSTDLITKTQYLKRSLIPFVGETVDHQDLIYIYDVREKGSGDLNLFRTVDDSLFISRFMRGGSEIAAQRMVDTISGIESVQLFQTQGDTLADRRDTTDTFLVDARAILSSDKNEIRLWTHPPRVLVISQDGRAAPHITEVRSAVEQNVTSPFGDKFFSTWQDITLPQNWNDGPELLQFEQVDGGPAGRQVVVKLGTQEPIYTDIVIVIADRSTLARLNVLWGVDAALTRKQATGKTATCFYTAKNRNGVTRGAYASIPSDLDADTLDTCIWEEVLHTLGPRQDATGTPFFTFDDTFEISNNKRENDILLIRALYESGANAGDTPDQVLTYLESIR